MKKRILALVLSLALLMSTVPGTLATSAASDSTSTQVEIVNPDPVVCDNCGAEDHVADDCVACTECKQTETHAEGCSLNLLTGGETEGDQPTTTPTVSGNDPAPTTDPTVGATVATGPAITTDPTTEPTTETTVGKCEHCGAELTEETVHTEECPLYEAPAQINVFSDIMTAESVEAMYAQILDIVNGEDTARYEALMALTFDELEQLRARVNQLDPEGDDTDTEDMLDMLSALPNAECPDCGLIGEHAETCTKFVVILGNGKVSGTITGTEFLNARDSNNTVQLTGNVTLTSQITVNSGETLILDLNGYVLNVSGFSRVINCNGGSVTIMDSSPNTEHKGTLVQVTSWLDKRCNYSIYDSKYNVDSANYFADRYILHTTTDAELWVYDGTGSTVIRGGVITGGKNGNGGGIAVFNGGTLNLQGGTIAGCASYRFFSATAYGDDVCIPDNIPDDFGYDNSNPNGGGVYCSSGSFNMTGGTIKYNWADYCGAGVFITGSNTVFTMNGGMITDNCTRGEGGGIAVRSGAVFNFGHGTDIPVISYNKTLDRNYTGGGGGISVSGARFDFQNGKVEYNKANISGGGIYCYRGGDVVASESSVISNNIAGSNGGGIYIQYGTVQLNGSTVENNQAGSSGGAVSSRVGSFIMNGGTLRGNTAGVNGGAVNLTAQNNITPHYDNGDLGGSASITGATIYNNKATGDGGAFYVSVVNSSQDITVDVDSCKIYSNEAGNDGGAIYLSGGTLTVKGDNTEVHDNTADNGGAFYVEDRVRNDTDTIPPYFVNTEILPDGYTKSEGGYWNKAIADYVVKYSDTKPGTVLIESGTFTSNKATSGHGGVMYVTGSMSSVEIKGGNMTRNSAFQNGGAVYVTGGNVKMTGGTIGGESKSGANTAIYGGGVYVNDGNFTMISGSLTNNVATSHGGGAYVHGGNITIGVKDCNALNTNHSVAPNDKTHPEVINNTAIFGGGLAVDGGNVDIHCGKIITNNAMNNGAGTNIFMYDSDNSDTEEAVLNHNNGTVGDSENHGIVVIGGKMNVPHEDGKLQITINYHDNGKQLNFDVWVGEAPNEYWLNLPYCPQIWETTQNGKGLTFVGWTHDTVTTSEPVPGEVDLSFIRDKNDYKALGDPIKIKQFDWKYDDDKEMFYIDFYAVWAPMTNNISYEIFKDNYGTVEDETKAMTAEESKNNTATYAFSQSAQTIQMTNPSIPGYTFKGWRITPSTSKISNWVTKHEDGHNGAMQNEAEEYLLDGTTSGTANLAGYSYKYENDKFILTTDRNFGNITLTALFEEDTVDYTFTLKVPVDVSKAGKVVATGASENYDHKTENQSYTVTIGKVTGNPGTATATAEYGFKLKDPKGWFTDEAGTTAVDTAWVNDGTLTPAKNANGLYEGGTFYAVIEYHLADLIISKTAAGNFGNSNDVVADQTFIFEVYQGDTLLTTVALKSGETVTIKDLTIGTTYTVKEVGGWSWRFDATNKDHTMVPVAEGTENTNVVAFSNNQTTNLWLSDEDAILNKHKSN